MRCKRAISVKLHRRLLANMYEDFNSSDCVHHFLHVYKSVNLLDKCSNKSYNFTWTTISPMWFLNNFIQKVFYVAESWEKLNNEEMFKRKKALTDWAPLRMNEMHEAFDLFDDSAWLVPFFNILCVLNKLV